MRTVTLLHPGRLVFGNDSIHNFVDDYLLTGHKKLLIVTASPILLLISPAVEKLKKNIDIVVDDSILNEPTINSFLHSFNFAKNAGVDSVAGIGGGSVLYYTGSEGVLGIVFALYAIFSGGIAGIFLLGIFTKRANKQGLYIAIVVCILFTAYAVLTSLKIDNNRVLDLGEWNFNQHKYMIGVYTHIIILVVGYLSSLFFKSEVPHDDLTIYAKKNLI